VRALLGAAERETPVVLLKSCSDCRSVSTTFETGLIVRSA
jgi:hypothetical protein